MAVAVRKVLFFAVLDPGYHGQVLRGVMRYAQRRPWAVSLGDWAYTEAIRMFDYIRPDGVILNAIESHWIQHLTGKRIPWVNIGYHPSLVPTVCTEMGRTVKLAFEHLFSRGFRNFGFYGPRGDGYSDDREAAFKAYLVQRGFDCLIAGPMRGRRAAEWVRALPKPIGVLAANDDEAFQLIQACREAGVRVPDQVAVIGVDNSMISLLCEPTLTTIAVAGDLIGERAAELLDGLMAGEPPPVAPVVIAPVDLIARQSTDTTGELATDVARAVRFIRDNARRRIDVSDVLRAVPVSRRWLERRFRTELGRGIHQEISAARIEEVKQMLLMTDLPLSVIADETGYGTAGNLSMIFRKATKTTPGEFRRRFRVAAGPV